MKTTIWSPHHVSQKVYIDAYDNDASRKEKKRRQKLIFQFSQPCGIGGKFLLLETGSLDNTIQKFLSAQPSWVMNHYISK